METLLQEKRDIDAKIYKLQMFVRSEKIREIIQEDIDLMYEQLASMNVYSYILQKRIDSLSR